MPRAEREKSSGFGYPTRRTNDAFTRLNPPSNPMIDSGSVERSKNSSSSVSGCGRCGGVAVDALLSFARLSLRIGAHAGTDPAGQAAEPCAGPRDGAEARIPLPRQPEGEQQSADGQPQG